MRRVVILQEYVPAYRQSFFEELIRLGRLSSVEISVVAGSASTDQRRRQDDAQANFVVKIPQREFRIAGKRIVIRKSESVCANADLVILEQARRNIDAYFHLMRRRRPYRIALWGHGRDYVKPTSRIDGALSNMLTSRADWFFAYTNEGSRAVQKSGFPAGQISVVKNAIDTHAIIKLHESISESDVTSFRDAHNLTKNVAVFVGGLDNSKRIPFLLKAAHLAHRADPSFRLLVIGAGRDQAIVEREARNNQAVVFTGPLHGREKATAILAAKVMAMPGRVGLVAVDSFAFGRPLVTTDWPWHAPEYEYLTNNVDCVVAPDEVQAFSASLLSLMNDDERLILLQKNCLSKSSEYSTEAMAERFLRGILGALRMEDSN